MATLLSISNTLAAQTKELSLAEAITTAKTNNMDLKLSQLQQQYTQADAEKMQNIYQPQVALSATGMMTNVPLNAFGSRLQQGSLVQEDFIPASLNNPTSLTNLNAQLSIQQPIYNKDAVVYRDIMQDMAKAAEYQSIRVEYVINHNIELLYRQLQLTTEAMTVLAKAKTTAEANLKLVNDNYEVGYAPYADVLAVELRISEIETDISQQEKNINAISNQLNYIMGTENGIIYTPSDALHEDISIESITDIPTDRSDYLAWEEQLKASEKNIKAKEYAIAPRVNAFASYELNERMDFSHGQHGYLLGVQASWTIYDGKKTEYETQKARIQLEQAQTAYSKTRSHDEMQLSAAKDRYSQAKTLLLSAEKSIKSAQEVLRIRQDRVAEGLEKVTDLLTAETQLSAAQMKKITALYQQHIALSEINMLTESNLSE